jgi:hypothetical protein
MSDVASPIGTTVEPTEDRALLREQLDPGHLFLKG